MNSGGDGGGTRAAAAAGMVGMSRSPFTVSQWQELEHQALIFKYMMAGLPVPPDIVLPIQKSFDSISHRFFHPATVGYCSFYGKKVDPEPGRCRRTDGKKWRCSKDAYPDSKYCERHMHRGRNRSRKPVEPQTMTQPSSSVTSLTPTEASPVAGTGPPAFQNLPLNAFPNSQPTVSGTSHSNHQLDSIPFGIPSKDYRYFQGLKPEVGEHSFFTDVSCSNGALQMDAPVNNIWPMIPSRVSSIPTATSSHNNIMQTEYSTQPSFFNNEYGSGVSVRSENHALRPFFDEWPRTRNSWSARDDDGSNQASFSTTQLSISIPMASPDFSASGSRSPHGD